MADNNKCKKCGYQNVRGAVVCVQCGKSLIKRKSNKSLIDKKYRVLKVTAVIHKIISILVVIVSLVMFIKQIFSTSRPSINSPFTVILGLIYALFLYTAAELIKLFLKLDSKVDKIIEILKKKK